jgi:hypothetical protein
MMQRLALSFAAIQFYVYQRSAILQSRNILKFSVPFFLFKESFEIVCIYVVCVYIYIYYIYIYVYQRLVFL